MSSAHVEFAYARSAELMNFTGLIDLIKFQRSSGSVSVAPAVAARATEAVKVKNELFAKQKWLKSPRFHLVILIGFGGDCSSGTAGWCGSDSDFLSRQPSGDDEYGNRGVNWFMC